MIKIVLKISSYLGLGLTLIPSFFVFMKVIDMNLNKHLMLLGTVLWFVTCPLWMGKK